MSGLLQIRGITDEQRGRLGELAKARYGSANVSRLIRSLIDAELAAAENPDVNPLPSTKYRAGKGPVFSYEKNRQSPSRRIELRLQLGERLAINELADAGQSSAQNFLVNLIRGYLTRKPALLGIELTELRKANHQLSVVGSNLNQIARALNAGQNRSVERTLIENLAVAVKKQTRATRDVLAANISRWDIRL